MSCRQRNDSSKQNDWSKWLQLQGADSNSRLTTDTVEWLSVNPLVTGSFNDLGFAMTDIDTAGYNYHNNKIILIETKEHNGTMRDSQRIILELLYAALTASLHETFKGVHLLMFENTMPENGFTTIKSFDGQRWVLLKEDYSSSLQIQDWYKQLML